MADRTDECSRRDPWARAQMRMRMQRRRSSLIKEGLWVAVLPLVLAVLCLYSVMRARRIAALRAPLVAAVEAGDYAKAKSLLDAGASPNAREKPVPPASSVLQGACYLLWPPLADEVDQGGTALTLASDKGDCRIMDLLLDRGADINARDYGGFTALECAVNSNASTRLDAVKLLVARHANVNTLDNCKLSPLFYAREWVRIRTPPEPDYVAMVEILERAGAKR